MTHPSEQVYPNHTISTHILTKRMTDFSHLSNCFRNISTHILTKRMTSVSRFLNPSLYISTHILMKRMTFSDSFNLIIPIYFNSHPHEEDDFHSEFFICYCDISTHILTKRMTNGLYIAVNTPIFQLTSSRRG